MSSNRTASAARGGLHELQASPGQRWLAGSLCVALLAAAGTTLPFAAEPVPRLAAWMAGHAAVVAFANAAATAFLFFQFRLTREAPLLALAAAFLFPSGLAALQLVWAPGVPPPDGPLDAAAQAADRLWAASRLGFPALLLAYAAATRAAPARLIRSSRRAGAAIAGTAAAVAVATSAVGWVAAARSAAAPLADPAPGAFAAAVAAALHGLAIALLLRGPRGRSFLHLWLAVGAFASGLGVVAAWRAAAAGAGERYTIGHEAGLLFAVIASTVFLGLLVYETNRQYVRLVQREQELRTANEKLRELSLVDGLTGVANRRRFDDMLSASLLKLAERRTPAGAVALLLLDIDHFKRYNDRYGHVAGDEVIRRIARTAEGCVRCPDDLVARYGGEEFGIVLPDADRDAALLVA
ncbi:GGDEF domain-containing protein, partial [Paenibacillus sp.]|uniref:GGDEF domain-containing protein n=1 Tax=Paenibacillus sp. TaxID=58172 RepID=UPI002D302089